MQLPVIQGLIKRRLLVNYRVDPAVVQRLLPTRFRPKLHDGYSIAGICLIRLEQIRPSGLPAMVGIASENAAHRIAVEWTDNEGVEREGVFIPRRDTGSVLNQIAGGRLFPGEHHAARFSVEDRDGKIALAMESKDKSVSLRVTGKEVAALPESSCFKSVADTSRFFEGGSVGFSVTRRGDCLDALRLETFTWQVTALEVSEVHSSYFEDREKFPPGSATFDHALIMRDIPHEWHRA